MLIISLVVLGVSLKITFHPMMILAVMLNAIFVLAYLWILYFESDTI